MQRVIIENRITGGGDIIHRIAVYGVVIFIILIIVMWIFGS